MINKFHKIINNKYSRFFKFIFFIRYLILIFFISTTLFLLIPKFFDYKKKELIIKNYLQKEYGLKIKEFDTIRFNSFPYPHLIINNLSSNLALSETKLRAKQMIIYPKLISIYNYENFVIKKLKLNETEVNVEFENISSLYKNLFKIDKKISFHDLDIKIKNLNKTIIDLKKIDFSNYGFRKNKVFGEIFNRKFNVKLQNNYKKIDLNLKNDGVFIQLNFLDYDKFKEEFIGEIKGKILNSNFRFNFIYDSKSLSVAKFIFRDRKLSLNGEGKVDLKPYFKIDFNSSLESINTNIFQQLNELKLSRFKELIKKMNLHNNLVFKPKRFSSKFIDDFNLKTTLTYGRLTFSKRFLIANSVFSCHGETNLLEEFPILVFDCLVESQDKRKLLKKLKIDYKNKKEPFNLIIKGYLNIYNNKIRFDLIRMNQDYTASEEDLKYFKKTFEETLFNQDFINIFRLSKIKKFILEIS